MENAFLKLDRMLWSENVTSGATLNIVVITQKLIIFANCGDSRSLLVRSKGIYFVTHDHKPDDPVEKYRIRVGHGSYFYLSFF